MRYIQIANENGLVNNDHLIHPLPTIPDPIPPADYVHVSIPCVLVPYVAGSLLNLLDPRRWDHGASRDSVNHSIGTVVDLITALGIDCGDSSAMLEYIKDLYQNGCELIAINPDGTERIVWSAHYCEQGGIGEPPPGWEPPSPPGPWDGGWDDPGTTELPPDLQDVDYCGAAIRAMEHMRDETDSALIIIEAATDLVSVLDALIPSEYTPIGAVADALASGIAEVIDTGVTTLQGYLASSDWQDTVQCAFFCALKKHKQLNNEVIRDVLYEMVRANILYTGIAIFWEPVLELGTPGSSVEVFGSLLSRRKLIRETYLGLDEPSNDCDTLCTNCAPAGWYARLDVRRPDVQGLITLAPSTTMIAPMLMDSAGLRSGYYVQNGFYQPELRFELAWVDDALLQRMSFQFQADQYYPVIDPSTDRIQTDPEGGGFRSQGPLPRGPNIVTFDWSPAITPNRTTTRLLMSKKATIGGVSQGMIRMTTIELWGSGTVPASLAPYAEEYT